MKIKILAVSKTDTGYIADGIALYLKRLQKYCSLELQFVKETPVKGADINQIKKEEGQRLLDAIPGDYYKVALDSSGKQFSSENFAAKLEQIRDFEGGKIVFIIGGPLGLGENILKVAHLKMSLSEMTFIHQMVRLILLEQIYRGFSILSGSEYHK